MLHTNTIAREAYMVGHTDIKDEDRVKVNQNVANVHNALNAHIGGFGLELRIVRQHILFVAIFKVIFSEDWEYYVFQKRGMSLIL